MFPAVETADRIRIGLQRPFSADELDNMPMDYLEELVIAFRALATVEQIQLEQLRG